MRRRLRTEDRAAGEQTTLQESCAAAEMADGTNEGSRSENMMPAASRDCAGRLGRARTPEHVPPACEDLRVPSWSLAVAAHLLDDSNLLGAPRSHPPHLQVPGAVPLRARRGASSLQHAKASPRCAQRAVHRACAALELRGSTIR